MAETPCFFGLTTVRVGARIVAYLQLWLQFFVVLMLAIKYFNQWWDVDERMISTEKTEIPLSASIAKKYYGELDFDFGIFSQLSVALLMMYASYNLKIATFTHNLMYINFWLILYSINFLTAAAFIICSSYRTGMLGLLFMGLIGWLIDGYMLYIVYEFHADEVYTVAVNDGQNLSSNRDQSAPRSHSIAVEIETFGTETFSTNDHRRTTLDIKNISQNTD